MQIVKLSKEPERQRGTSQHSTSKRLRRCGKRLIERAEAAEPIIIEPRKEPRGENDDLCAITCL